MNVLVLGASPKPDRYSYQAVQLLEEKGHCVFPVHPRAISIGSTRVFSSIKDVPASIHTVTFYVSKDVSTACQEMLLCLKAKRFIFNPGADNETLAQKAQEKGIEVLDACTLVLLKTGQF